MIAEEKDEVRLRLVRDLDGVLEQAARNALSAKVGGCCDLGQTDDRDVFSCRMDRAETKGDMPDKPALDPPQNPQVVPLFEVGPPLEAVIAMLPEGIRQQRGDFLIVAGRQENLFAGFDVNLGQSGVPS